MKNNLKSVRKSRNLTQGDIALIFKVSVQTVFKWEDGRAPVAKKHWKNLAMVLNVSEDELEAVLVQTLLDGCLARNDSKALINARASHLYSSDLLLSAIAEFEGRTRSATSGDAVLSEAQKIEYERALLERDRRIFELEKQVEELKREIAERRAKPTSISSALNITELENEVK